jgi:predicted enzyme related to lactoylglutathione lyase
MSDKKPIVTGVGGIFFKSDNPDKMKEWYSKNLGLVTNEYGSLFEFRDSDNPESKGYLQWSPFDKETKYFAPSSKDYMINYRVVNIEAMIENMISEGIEIIGEIEEYEYGKFAHVVDPEGNKLELWEPIDKFFTDLYEGKTTK